MPEKERAKAIMEITKDLPARYRVVIEDYFKALSNALGQAVSGSGRVKSECRGPWPFPSGRGPRTFLPEPVERSGVCRPSDANDVLSTSIEDGTDTDRNIRP